MINTLLARTYKTPLPAAAPVPDNFKKELLSEPRLADAPFCFFFCVLQLIIALLFRPDNFKKELLR